MKILFIADPLENFKIYKDSTYALMKSADQKGFDIYFAEIQDLWADGNQAKVLAKKILFRPGDHWFSYENIDKTIFNYLIADFDLVLMRKDPPFNMKYIYATYLLELAEKNGAKIINRPGAIRNSNEKCFILNFPELITKTLVSSNMLEIRNFLAQENEVILKPLDGMGGASIFKVNQSDSNLSVILEVLTERGTLPIMAQRYIPEIKDGDKRILMIDGNPVSHGLSRIPKEGEIRGNLAAGARGEVRALNKREEEICKIIGPKLKQMGLIFVGLDIIGDYVTEINVTSPTGIQEIQNFLQEDIAGRILEAGLEGCGARSV